MVRKRNGNGNGHVVRSTDLSEAIMQGTANGGVRRSTQNKSLVNNIKERTGSGLEATRDRIGWRRIAGLRKASESEVVPQG